jgi:hypothetical protein
VPPLHSGHHDNHALYVNVVTSFCSSSNLEELTKGIQMIAALMDDDDDGNKLQDAAKNLTDAFSNLLKAAHGSPGAPDNVSIGELLELNQHLL